MGAPELASALDAAGDAPLHRCLRGPSGPDGGTTLWQERGEQVAQLLLEFRADANAEGAGGEAPLRLAVRTPGAHGLARALLAAQADPGQADRSGGETALMAAARSRDAGACRLLLEARATAGQRDRLGRTAAGLARGAGGAGAAALLGAWEVAEESQGGCRAAEVPVDVVSVSGETVYHVLIPASGTAELVKQRIFEEHGTPRFQQRLVHGDAVLSDKEPLTELLAALPQPLALTLVVVASNPETNNALMDAADDGEAEAVRQALRASADPNHMDEMGWTPMAIAATSGHSEVARILCSAGAETSCQGPSGETPMFLAVDGGHVEVARLLCQAGADGDTPLHSGVSPLHAAVLAGREELVSLLCDCGADLGRARWDGKASLHLASSLGHLEVVTVLCRHGAAVDAAAALGGETPLLLAAGHGHLEVVSWLLHARADTDRAGTGGCTPVEAAMKAGFPEVVRLLCEAGAEQMSLPPALREMLRISSQGLGCMC